MRAPDELYKAGTLMLKGMRAEPDNRKAEIATRHVLAAIRVLSDNLEVYDLTTERLERGFGRIAEPRGDRKCPRCLEALAEGVLSHFCKVECDACGEPKTSDALGWVTFNPDGTTRHVCPRCNDAGYIAACND